MQERKTAADLSNVYSDRNEIAIDILKELDQGITSIQIIGVSLYDFVNAGGKLHEVWRTIGQILGNEIKITTKKIKILIIHPDSLGAELRSVSEHRQGSRVARRLRQDVNITTAHLLFLPNIFFIA